MACIKMGVSPTNPKQQTVIPFFKHTEILHMLISVSSTALAAGCMVYTERAEMAAVSCGTSHASAVSTPLRWIFKNAI